MQPRRSLQILLPMVLGLAGPAAANAATHCVQRPGCSGTEHPTIAAALAAADTGDMVRIGPGTFDEGPLEVTQAITVEGVGPTTVVLGGTTTVLDVEHAAAVVRDLAVRVPSDGNGIATEGLVERVLVEAPSNVGWNHGTGVVLQGTASIRDSRISLRFSAVTASTAVRAIGQGGTITDTVLEGGRGLDTEDALLTVRRARIFASRGIVADGSTLSIGDSLIEVAPPAKAYQGTSMQAILALSGAPSTPASLDVRGVTVTGPGADAVDTEGIGALSANGGTATITVRSTLIRGLAVAASTSAASVVDLGFSDFDPARLDSSAGGSIVQQPGTNQFTEAPTFVDGPAGDFTPAPGSALIDRGEPGPAEGAPGGTDVAGRARVTDGDGDGVARADVGAFEAGVPLVQPAAPSAPVPGSPPAPAPPMTAPVPEARLRFGALPRGPLAIDREGRATVLLRCTGAPLGRRCYGRLRIWTTARRPRLIGRADVKVLAQTRRAFRLRLDAAARRWIRKKGRMRVRLVLRPAPSTSAAGRTRLVTLVPKPHRRS